jgi:FkbM family methyltransferase
MNNSLYNFCRQQLYKAFHEFDFYKKRQFLKGTKAHNLESKYLGCFEILQLIKQESQQINSIYDIGACIGTFSILATAFFPEATIHAFEPLNDNFQKLECNTNDLKSIFLHQLGLGSENKITDIYITNDSDSSSILNPSTDEIKKYWNISVTNTQKIEVYKLDDYICSKKIQMPELIKIDVQGYELEVLKGSAESLKSAKWLILEISFKELYEGQAFFHEIIHFMAKNKFYLFSLGRGTATGIHQLVQADCLFKKQG